MNELYNLFDAFKWHVFQGLIRHLYTGSQFRIHRPKLFLIHVEKYFGNILILSFMISISQMFGYPKINKYIIQRYCEFRSFRFYCQNYVPMKKNVVFFFFNHTLPIRDYHHSESLFKEVFKLTNKQCLIYSL